MQTNAPRNTTCSVKTRSQSTPFHLTCQWQQKRLSFRDQKFLTHVRTPYTFRHPRKCIHRHMPTTVHLMQDCTQQRLAAPLHSVVMQCATFRVVSPRPTPRNSALPEHRRFLACGWHWRREKKTLRRRQGHSQLFSLFCWFVLSKLDLLHYGARDAN